MDIQRLKNIWEELKQIQDSCMSRYNQFFSKYGKTQSESFFQITFDENIYHEYLYVVCEEIYKNLRAMKDLQRESEKGREIAISKKDYEMLKNADGIISGAIILYNYWKELTEETFSELEDARKQMGFKMRVQVRTNLDDYMGDLCF